MSLVIWKFPFPCETTESQNLMVGGPEKKGKTVGETEIKRKRWEKPEIKRKTVGETEIKGKMIGETEIKSKNEKVNQTAQVIEIKDSCFVLQDKVVLYK